MARSLLSDFLRSTPHLTSLVGRQDEITHLKGMLRDPAIRLITLTGPGGIGKTRLAMAVAEQIRDDDAESLVTMASLAPIADHHLVLPTVARVFGLSEHAEQTTLERLATYLNDRDALLVLDNVEHLLEAAPEIAALLSCCPHLRILATGREPLHLHGEHQFPVPSLSLPPPDVQDSGTSVLRSDAVRLFVERANDVAPDFHVTEANASAVAEISRRLDGVPLALELAAARMKVISPRELLARLDDPLVLLAGGPQNVPTRQRTMREVVRWSYDLLSAAEQSLFRQLSVFAGGFSLEAAEAIVDGDDVLENLASLVDKSLVRRVGESDEVTRFGMLEPIRQFAFEQLSMDGVAACKAHQSHARYFSSITQELEGRFDGPEGPACFRRIALEHDNVLSALRWLRQTNQEELGLTMIGNLGVFWHQYGYLREGRTQTEAILERTSTQPTTRARMKALTTTSWLWVNSTTREDIMTAHRMLNEAFSLAREHGDQLYQARSLFLIGSCHMRIGEQEQAYDRCEQSLELFKELGNDAMVVRVLAHLGALARRAGDLVRSRALMEEGLTLAREQKLTMVVGPVLGGLALLEERAGNDSRAVKLYRERLTLYRDFGIPRGIAETLEYVGFLVRRHRQPAEAVNLFALASAYRERSGTHYHNVMDAPDLDVELQALRTELPEDAFQSAWQQGLHGTVDEVIELLDSLFDADAPHYRSGPAFDLTPREIDVLKLITAGRSNREISEDLFISIRTVERHIENLYRKLDVHSRAEAIDFGRNHLS